MTDPLTKEELMMIRSLQKRGYAVVIFTPEEVGEASADSLEGHMISKGWEYLSVHDVLMENGNE